MSVTPADVHYVAALARLALAEDQVSTLVTDLNRILAHMDVLQHVQLDAPPDANAADSDVPTALRPDVVGAVPLQVPPSTFAPAERDGFFLVPRLDTHE